MFLQRIEAGRWPILSRCCERVRELLAELRRAFPRRVYRRRALVESLFFSVNHKLSARAPGRSLRMQMRQALLLGLSLNLYRLKHRYLFLRVSTVPRIFKTRDHLHGILLLAYRRARSAALKEARGDAYHSAALRHIVQHDAISSDS
jgi:hypothetical protein